MNCDCLTTVVLFYTNNLFKDVDRQLYTDVKTWGSSELWTLWGPVTVAWALEATCVSIKAEGFTCNSKTSSREHGHVHLLSLYHPWPALPPGQHTLVHQ